MKKKDKRVTSILRRFNRKEITMICAKNEIMALFEEGSRSRSGPVERENIDWTSDPPDDDSVVMEVR